MDERIKSVMAAVFGSSPDDNDETASVDTIVQCDSLISLNLVTALEEEFGVQFTDVELLDMVNFKIIKLTLLEK